MRNSLTKFAAAIHLIIIASVLRSESVVRAGTPIEVQVDHRQAMRKGEPIEAHVVFPVYVGTQLVIPTGSLVSGHVMELSPATKQRRRARLQGDFTPFHEPIIDFDRLTLPDNTDVALSALPAAHGAPTIRITGSQNNGPSRSYVRRLWNQVMTEVQSVTQTFTAPGKRDRLVDAMYGQLPYHPERIKCETQWIFELAQPLHLSQSGRGPLPPNANLQTETKVWKLHAYLATDLTSKETKVGSPVEAVVSEPLYRSDQTLEVPEGAILVGTVTQAQSAKLFGRSGRLRFAFRQLRFPQGMRQPVQANLTAANTQEAQNLTLDAEGGFRPATKSRLAVPLITAFLANSALDGDGNSFVVYGVAANGFGLIGRMASIASASPNVAVGFGFYATATSVYNDWIARGRDVIFSRGTRVEIEATPSSKRVLSAPTK